MKRFLYLVLTGLIPAMPAFCQLNEVHFTRAGAFQGIHADFNADTLTRRSFIGTIGSGAEGDVSNAPIAGGTNSWWNLINIRHRNGDADGFKWGTQLAVGMTANINRLFLRGQIGWTDTIAWTAWNEVFTTNTPRVLINGGSDDGFNALQVSGSASIRSKLASNPLIGGRNPLYLDALYYGSSNSSAIVFTKGATSIAEIATDLLSTGGKDIYMIAGQGQSSILLNPYNGAGNVGIGTTTPQSKLAVAGTITAQKIKVTTTGWPDHVFQPGYTLPSLPEVEEYIRTNQHLPEIPSAAEVEKNGQDVGEMNKKLLQKIEELTLYMISLQKQLKAQQKEITDLKSKHP